MDPDCVSVRIDNSAASANSLLCKIMLAVKSVLNCGGERESDGESEKKAEKEQESRESERERKREEAFLFFRFIRELCANLLQC